MRRGIISRFPKRSSASSSLHTSVDLAWQTIHGRGLQLGGLAQPASPRPGYRGYPAVGHFAAASLVRQQLGEGWFARMRTGPPCCATSNAYYGKGLLHAHRHSDLFCNIHPAAPPHKRRSLPAPTWQLHGMAHWRTEDHNQVPSVGGLCGSSSGSNLLPSASISTSFGFHVRVHRVSRVSAEANRTVSEQCGGGPGQR
jgi:hypothetical protein